MEQNETNENKKNKLGKPTYIFMVNCLKAPANICKSIT